MAKQDDTTDIFDLCTPVSGKSRKQQNQPGIYPHSQRGMGYTGAKKAIICCLLEENKGPSGEYKGVTVYPVAAKIQQDSRLNRIVRNIEFRATQTVEGQVGLLYRKMPFPGSRPNSWIESAESAVDESIEEWGQFTSDHVAEAYQFERMDNPPAPPGDLPKPKDLMRELLTDYFIDSMDHPVIQKLLGQSSSGYSSMTTEEDDDSAY
jgi:hypothetical protein